MGQIVPGGLRFSMKTSDSSQRSPTWKEEKKKKKQYGPAKEQTEKFAKRNIINEDMVEI